MNNFAIFVPDITGKFDSKKTLLTVQIMGSHPDGPVLLKLNQEKLRFLDMAIQDIFNAGYIRRIISGNQRILENELRVHHCSDFIRRKIKSWLVKSNIIEDHMKMEEVFITLINFETSEIKNSSCEQHMGLTVITSKLVTSTETVQKPIHASQSNMTNTKENEDTTVTIEDDVMVVKLEPEA